ncbi:FecR family protein [Tistrella mobilis]|uniref:FecR n=1 Tax=Tistrella mobilis (strain KA081020-065) TaxID=1110502 RepID=I3TUC7_TISMK|nr:FecR domain-containing protein [Tistrella mobilis]AFK56365.1 putative FecR [Tistrella mobilis KA081020-065]
MTGHAEEDQDAPVDPILETAVDWLLKTRACPHDERLRSAAIVWRAAHPAHEQAWRRAERVWKLTGALPGRPAAAAADTPARVVPLRRRRSLGRMVAVTAAVALAASVVVALLPTIELHLRADYVTARGEQRRITLEDGTLVILAADSAIRVAYGPSERRVELIGGDAFFTVAEDRSRPFAVTGDDLRVVDIGTAFAVGIDPEALDIGVESGAVHVAYAGAVPEGSPRDARLDPGGRLHIDRATGRFNQDRVQPAQIALWRDGLLVVENQSLGHVVAEIRRRYPGMIVVRDEALMTRRVTGVYDLRNPEAALRTALLPHGGRVSTLTPYVLIVSGA